MPAAMEVNQEPDCGPKSMREHGSLLALALLAFAVGGTSGLVGAVFRLVLDRSDRFRGAVIDWAPRPGRAAGPRSPTPCRHGRQGPKR